MRIILTHENVSTGGVNDATIAAFGLEVAEVNRLLRIMAENNISIILNGHHHKGNIAYRHGGKYDLSEFNAAAYHRMTGRLMEESMGYWYVCSIDRDRNVLTVTPYYAETAERMTGYEFPLIVNNQ